MNLTKSMMLYKLNEIKVLMNNSIGDISTKAHKYYIKTLIENMIKELK